MNLARGGLARRAGERSEEFDVGGPDAMRRQLAHLIAMSERDNVEIRVLPTSTGWHDGGVGPFTLVDFAQAQFGYVEIVNGAICVQDQDQVAGYAHIVTRLREVALSQADTVTAIRTRAFRMGAKDGEFHPPMLTTMPLS